MKMCPPLFQKLTCARALLVDAVYMAPAQMVAIPSAVARMDTQGMRVMKVRYLTNTNSRPPLNNSS